VHSLKGAKHVADIRNYGLAAGFTIAPLPGEPAKRPYEIAMVLGKGLLRALRRRHHPAGAALHQHRGRDRPPGQRPGRCPATEVRPEAPVLASVDVLQILPHK
jgi:hypothetical protein